jgi:hypothetical protein
MDPTKFKDGAWNIPESGNGIPDILDECKWELDWICRMQSTEGGFHHKLTSEKWFEGMPHDESNPRYIYEVTTHDTALGAAVLALASRLFAKFDEAKATEYLERSIKAWQFLKRHPDPIPKSGFRNPPGNTTGEYSDPEDIDNRLWAAAELYRTTGESEYGSFFQTWWEHTANKSWGWNDWQHFYSCAYWAYLHSDRNGSDDKIQSEIRRELTKRADELVDRTRTNPYKNAARLDVPEWIGWGSFAQSTKYSFKLLQAYTVSRDPKYLTSALLNLDTQLGANPLSMSFITGLGKRFPKDPLHHPSIHDDVKDPVPGIPVFGVAAHLTNNQPYYIAAQKDENSFPHSNTPMDPYPILRRFIDAHELVPMTEFTIIEMAVAAGVFNLLADLDSPMQVKP